MIAPQTLPKLSDQQLNDLINCFETNEQLQHYPGRKFGLDINRAVEIVTPIINSVLGGNTWSVAGGNFFETETGYRVHADTGREDFDLIWQTFVFPLRQEFRTDIPVRPERNRLLILNQTWSGPAAFFLRGGQRV
jgi:hypothetical protein